MTDITTNTSVWQLTDGDGAELDLHGGTIHIEGIEVIAYLSPEDGTLVVQIDTPADDTSPHFDQFTKARVYINDGQIHGEAP